MNLFIIHAILGNQSETDKEIKEGKPILLTPELIDKLSGSDLQELCKQLLSECQKLKSENKELKEENKKITWLASRTSVAFAELRQGISDAVGISEAYFKED